MQLMGMSLEDCFQKCKKMFNLKTVCLLAIQLIDRIQSLHDQSFLHRDIKPENFMMGLDE
jgi:serine/threonine protein kinase